MWTHDLSRVTGICHTTLYKWCKRSGDEGDLRRSPKRPPAYKVTTQERQEVLAELNDPKRVDLSPKQLANEGRYLVSVLKHRLPSDPPQEQNRSEKSVQRPNKLWARRIKYLPTAFKGRFVYLYNIMEVFSRKIVRWSVEESEQPSAGYALT